MVKLKVDKERRENLKKLHTATHLLNYATRKLFGPHIWQNGSNLKEDYGTLDITHYENFTFEQIKEIENLVNDLIFEGLDVKIEYKDRIDAEKKYGFIIYQGGAIPLKKLRIVKVDDLDVEACGGLHVSNTKEIKIFKIVNSQKIQDGVVRLKYVVGKNALKFIENEEKILDELKNLYNVEPEKITKTSEKFFKEWKELKKENQKYEDKIKELILKDIESNKDKVYKIDLDNLNSILEIFKKLKNKNKILESNKFIITNNKKDLEKYKLKKIIDKKDLLIGIK